MKQIQIAKTYARNPSTKNFEEVTWGGINILSDSGIPPETVAVGIQIDFANKTFTRLGLAATDAFNFSNYPPFGGRRACTVNRSTGEITYIDDFTQTPPNGLMIEQPKFYYKVEPLTVRYSAAGTLVVDKANYWISQYPLIGFKLHPAFTNNEGKRADYYYISAWAINSSDGIGASGNSQDDTLFNRGLYGTNGFLTTTYNYQPISNHTRSWFRNGAKGVGDYINAKFSLVNTQVAAAEQLLQMIEYGPNLQTGLASGVTGVDDNSSYNCSARCGSTFENGLISGIATSTTIPYGIPNNNKSYSYRGVEDFYGNIWEWIDGINIWGNGSLSGGKVFICNDWNFADDKITDNYIDTGIIIPNSDGYIRSFAYSKDFDWLLITGEVGTVNGVAGDSARPVGDYFYKSINLNGHRCALLGGRWNHGLWAGPFYWNLVYGSSHAHRAIGARLIYIP